MFIRHEEYKSQATNYKYRLCSHSLQPSRRQYSVFSHSAKPAGGFKQLHNKLCSHSLQPSRRQCSAFSRSAKPAGGFKQLHNKLCMSFSMVTEGIVFLHCSYFCNCTKNPLKVTVISTTALKNSFCSHYLRVFLDVLLCKILESRWVFKSVHRENVLIFHSSSPFVRWKFW